MYGIIAYLTWSTRNHGNEFSDTFGLALCSITIFLFGIVIYLLDTFVIVDNFSMLLLRCLGIDGTILVAMGCIYIHIFFRILQVTLLQ